MDANHKKTLRAISLELRHILEGLYSQQGKWQPGDLERRLNSLGVWSDRPSKPLAEMSYLSTEDRTARHVVDAFIEFRAEAGVSQKGAFAEFVREAAYSWANRLLALRCMEARGIIDEVILQKEAYGGRSLVHSRLARREPELCVGEDDGLFEVLCREFEERAEELPGVFDPDARSVSLRPSISALKRCIRLLSGLKALSGQEPATDEVFQAQDAFGWAYQYWNAEEKDRVFEMVRKQRGKKIEGADIIPATQLYTEPYMVKFLVQNSLGATWLGMHPESTLDAHWEYFVKDVDRAAVEPKAVKEITFLDPAMGSGHFLLEAFELFYSMYEEEGLDIPEDICAAILNHNLYGIDIDPRAVQIGFAVLWMKAKEKAPDLDPKYLTTFHEHLIATNIRLPKGKNHLEEFLERYPEDKPLEEALKTVFEGLENAPELGSLLQIEEPVEEKLKELKEKTEFTKKENKQLELIESSSFQQGDLPFDAEEFEIWKGRTIKRLKKHFDKEAETADLTQSFFGKTVLQGLSLFNLLSKKYDVIAANPPYMGSKKMGAVVKTYVSNQYKVAKRDLYAAFLLRNRSLNCRNGYTAAITPYSWMFQNSFETLRETFLSEDRIHLIVQLGRHAFSEVDPPSDPGLVVFQKSCFQSDHKTKAFRLTASRPADEQAKLLVEGIWKVSSNYVYRFEQKNFLLISGKQIVYWTPKSILELLIKAASQEKYSLANHADVLAGLKTAKDLRFTRYFWEINDFSKWPLYSKGGGYARWHGKNWLCAWWQNQEQPYREYKQARTPHSERFLEPGYVYTAAGRGSLSVREMLPNTIFGSKGPGIFPFNKKYGSALAAVLNSRISSYCVRCSSHTVDILVDTVLCLPFPIFFNDDIGESFAKTCIEIKRDINSFTLTEANFEVSNFRKYSALSLKDYHLKRLYLSALLHSIEGALESKVFGLFGIKKQDWDAIFDDLGVPVGHLPLTTGSFSFDDVWSEVFSYSPAPFKNSFARETTQLSSAELSDLMERSKALFNNILAVENDVEAEVSDDTDEEAQEESLAFTPVPNETLLETISSNLQIHPLSTLTLIANGLINCGWTSDSEDKRFLKDYFSVATLNLLGYRWPTQDLSDTACETNGILSLVESGLKNSKGLEKLFREKFAFEQDDHEFDQTMSLLKSVTGLALEEWLRKDFFPYHITQFKKRPIIWQIESRKLNAYSSKNFPVFSSLIFCHKVDADFLPKIRSQYLETKRSSYEAELRVLEKIPPEQRTEEQAARAPLLEEWIEELEEFSQKLNQISVIGFGPKELRPKLRQYAIDDATLHLKAFWLSKLEAFFRTNNLEDWQKAAAETNLHEDLPQWVKEALENLDHACSTIGPQPPKESELQIDPTSAVLAKHICQAAGKMVKQTLQTICDRWMEPFNETVLAPLKQQLKTLKAEQAELKQEQLDLDTRLERDRRSDIALRLDVLKGEIRQLNADIRFIQAEVKTLRQLIEQHECPEADTWEPWLAQQPMYDAISSLDGKRNPPNTVAEFVAQESTYTPDLNDGVRVNIAPLQKAGILACDVLSAKDVDEAISDRAEWRSDERRWCREGKLPHPGWWDVPEA